MTVRAVVTGAAGRMGTRIIKAVRDTEGIRLAGATARPGAAVVGLDAGLAAGLGPLEVTVVDALGKVLGQADVVIDFTNAESSAEHARLCAEAGVALVVGSTGFSAEAKEAVTAAAHKIPIVMAPNMSVGVNLMFHVAAEVARVLGDDFHVEILEAHHAGKKDAPSGTALRLAEAVARALDRDPARDLTFARKGQIGQRPPREIGVQTLRGGDVVGEHTLYFFGQGERLEITHRASSRDTFALGAARAGLWVVGRPPGLYDMQDVLGFAAR